MTISRRLRGRPARILISSRAIVPTKDRTVSLNKSTFDTKSRIATIEIQIKRNKREIEQITARRNLAAAENDREKIVEIDQRLNFLREENKRLNVQLAALKKQ